MTDLNDMMIGLVAKTAKIEAQLDTHKELLEKIEQKLTPMVEKVHNHDVTIKSFGWFLGLIITFFTTKFFGKF